MSNFVVKFQSLDEQAQREVEDFVGFLIEKKGRRKPPLDPEEFRKRLLNVSVWSEEDVKPIEEARQHFNTWEVTQW